MNKLQQRHVLRAENKLTGYIHMKKQTQRKNGVPCRAEILFVQVLLLILLAAAILSARIIGNKDADISAGTFVKAPVRSITLEDLAYTLESRAEK